MPITVPKPITAPPPVQVTHTPYNTANAAWNANQNANQQFFSGGSSFAPIPVGTILSQSQPAATTKPTVSQAPASPFGNTPVGYYKPADPRLTQSYLKLLQSGYTVDPTTGKAGMSYRGLGGQLGSGPSGYRGPVDPVAAQAAIQQFQQGGGIATYGPGGYVRPGYNPNTGQPYSSPAPQVPAGFWGGTNTPGMAIPSNWGEVPSPNYFNPQFSQPGTMNVGGLKNYAFSGPQYDTSAAQIQAANESKNRVK